MNLLELNAIIEALEPFIRYRESIENCCNENEELFTIADNRQEMS